MNSQKSREITMSNIIDGNQGYYEILVGNVDAENSCEEGSAAKIIRSDVADFIRQPCKARGVTIKSGQNPHVARFAYIDIPLGSVHGTVLSCCHPVCIASGRRFRYCTHCETAVAKRNFNMRHAHGNLNSPPDPPPRSNIVPFDKFGGGTVCRDGAETSIPTVISINDHKDSRSLTDDGSCAVVTLSNQEYEIIKFLRSRPANDYPPQIAQWKETLLRIIDKEHDNPTVHALSPTTDVEREECGTSTDENEDDNEASSLFVDDFGIGDVTGFFEG